MKKFIILIISMMVTFSASSQDLDSVRRIATETAIEDFLRCRLSKEANVFIIDYSTKINSRRQLEIHIMRVIEDEEKFVVDPAIGFLREHSYRRCVEREGKLFYWRSDTMTQEDFELLDKYGMLYYAKDSIDYEMKLWEYLPNYHDDIEAAQYFFCTSNPKYYKRIIDIYPKTVKLRCRK
jgi:hypothetical protein